MSDPTDRGTTDPGADRGEEPGDEVTFEADREWLAQLRADALAADDDTATNDDGGGDNSDLHGADDGDIESTSGADSDLLAHVRDAVARGRQQLQQPPESPRSARPDAFAPPTVQVTAPAAQSFGPPATYTEHAQNGPPRPVVADDGRPLSAPRWEVPARLDSGSRLGAPPELHPAQHRERRGRIGWWWLPLIALVVAGGTWFLVRDDGGDPVPSDGSTPVSGTGQPSEDTGTGTQPDGTTNDDQTSVPASTTPTEPSVEPGS